MAKATLGGGAITGPLQMTGQALIPGAAVTLDASLSSLYTLTPGEDETITASNVTNGEEIVLVVTTSGVTSRTLTFGTGFKSTGTLATGTTTAKIFVMKFIAVGGVLLEVSRTAAQ